MTTTTITILAGRADEARDRIKKMEEKAKRYGVEFAAIFGPVYQEERLTNPEPPRRPKKVMTDVLDVTITGETPKVGEFEFLASIELTDAGNFVDVAPGVEIGPQYRNTDGHCDHCKTTRLRKNVYAVRNMETDEELQVGRTCLRDFLGIDDPKIVIGKFKFWREFNDSEEGFESFGCAEWCESLEYLLAKTNVCIRLWGWASKGMAEASYGKLTATIEYIWGMYGNDDESRKLARQIRDEQRDSDTDTAQEVIEWVRTSTADNDYMHNLRVAFSDDMLITTRRTALAISAVAAMHRAKERDLKRTEMQKANRDSKHQGTVEERLKGLELTLEANLSMGDNGWGPRSLLKFKDVNGNLFCWFTGSAPNLDIGQRIMADGTVKAHKEFHGILETQLTRVTVREIFDV